MANSPKEKLRWIYGELERVTSKPLVADTLPLKTPVWSRELYLITQQAKDKPYHKVADLDRLHSSMSRFDHEVQAKANAIPQDKTARAMLLSIWRAQLAQQKMVLKTILDEKKY